MPTSSKEVLGDSLIPVINKLQDIFNQVSTDVKLPLPQVAVVGSQSSGKSSVLESLVGKDFLPRGSDIVTRRPLLLQLVKVPVQPSGRPSEWGEFLHNPGKLFYDFNRIRDEIQLETDRVVGTSKNVSNKPIRLRVYSPHVLTMTLVDLPGITKLPVGDQPTNIEQRIREMVLEYIRQPDCIILAVSPANADLSNSDALQLAHLVDPNGDRTIGVLTKLDIMDRGTNAAHILKNQVFPLKLGYVGVVNRCQEDINKAKAMADARVAEEAYFTSHSEYADVTSCTGIATLARRLNAVLVEHIRAALPTLRRRISELTEAKMAELRDMGTSEPLGTRSAKGAYLLQLLCDYAERYGAMLDGRHQDLSRSLLSGGARIRYVFNEVFGPRLRELDPNKGMTDSEIFTVIKNGAGLSGNLLVPQEPFELLVRRAIMLLQAPALQCKDIVHEELLRIAEQACPREVARFPELQRHLAAAVFDFIVAGTEPADKMIRSLIECEHDYINQDHVEFIGGKGAIREALTERSKRMESRREEVPPPAEAKNMARTKTTASASDIGVKANGLNQAVGLKGLPESAPHAPDELVSRVRRRSDDGVRTPESHAHAAANAAAASAAAATSSSSFWTSVFWGRGSYTPEIARPHDDIMMSSRVNKLSSDMSNLRSEIEDVEVSVIRRLVDSYFSIVRRNITDVVPKTIMHFMVNNTRRGLQQHLIRTLYKEDMLDGLLAEREDVVKRRTSCQDALIALKAAAKALEEVPAELSAVVSEDLPPVLLSSQHSMAGLPLGGMLAAAGGGGSSLFGSWSPSYDDRVFDRHPSMNQAARAAAEAASSLMAHNSDDINSLA